MACSEWFKLFFRLGGDKRWRDEPHFKSGARYGMDFNRLDPAEATALLNDPSWSKVVFFRDPLERLLSAFLDKFVHGNHYSLRVFDSKVQLTFAQFVAKVTSCVGDRDCMRTNDKGKPYLPNEGLHSKTNPHWRSQAAMCGLEHYLPRYTFIGSFDRLAEHSRHILTALGLWDAYGADGWGKGADGSGPMFGSGHSAVHSTSSRERVEKYYTPKLRSVVEAAYSADYSMMRAVGLLEPKPGTLSDFMRTGEGLRAHLAERETELKAGPGDHGERLTTVSGYVPSRVAAEY